MNIFIDRVKLMHENLKIDSNAFGFVGELYAKENLDNAAIEPYQKIINKYVSINTDGFYVNRKPAYFSACFDDAIHTIIEVPEDYKIILKSDIPAELKRYLLFTFTEYIMHSICKLLNICFIYKELKDDFYKSLKNYLVDLSHLLVGIQFNEHFQQMEPFHNGVLESIVHIAKILNINRLREHTEMDHKMLLIIGYMLYFDYIHQYDLILSPLLGAAQIPTLFNALYSYMNQQDIGRQPIPFEYIKYSTYEEDGSDLFFSIDEQKQWLSENYSSTTKVLLIDESLGTGTTVLRIKNELEKYFITVDTAALEYRWDKKIIWNTDRDWFNINDIDYVTPIYYRHYAILEEQILHLKNGTASYQPFVPYTVYDDINYHTYIAEQNINEKNKATMDSIFYRTKIIKNVLYTNGRY